MSGANPNEEFVGINSSGKELCIHTGKTAQKGKQTFLWYKPVEIRNVIGVGVRRCV